ncbi:MAG: phosphodiester glycosidase family protein [Eubacteriales bacterium]|nr:phosphodiester glycosidase family protein [Eubacteriales bacterium]
MKRGILLILAFCALTTLSFSAARAESGNTGDLDQNGRIGAADAAKTLRAAGGYESLDAQASVIADATGNMEVGAPDAVAILLYATGKIGAFSQLSLLTPDSLLGERHMDRFSYSGTQMKNDGYVSRNVSVTVSSAVREDYVYYVADIYLQYVNSLKTAFSGGVYLGGKERTLSIARQNSAILAINGDGYSSQKLGPMVRNGVWYRDSYNRGTDLCVLYRNGELKTYAADSVSLETLEQSDVYQIWTGGPRLLDDEGKPLTKINSERILDSHSARTAIGYYEPGHYCFVVVDGSQNANSKGATLPQLAELFGALGCKQAYVLSGGNSSVMATQNSIINTNPDGGRTVSDILYLCEPGMDAGETP